MRTFAFSAKKLLTNSREYAILLVQTEVRFRCGSGSVVEHLLAKEKVAGSIPVSRSHFYPATSPSGKARLCKSCTSGSSPLVASQTNLTEPNEVWRKKRNVIDCESRFSLFTRTFHPCDSNIVTPSKPSYLNAPI
jgi:hypothetical protein